MARSSIRPDVVDVGHLRAADALVDPAHHVAEDALRVVLELGGDVGRGPVRVLRERDRQDVLELAAAAAPSRSRPGARARRPGGSGWRAGSRPWGWEPRRSSRRPSGGRSSARASRAIRSGIAHMPLPICARPARPQARPMSTLASLVGGDPGLRLHVGLAHHRAGLHRGVDLVAGAVEEAGVDEGHARLAARMHSLRLTVVRRSSSMMPIFTVFGGRPSDLLDVREDLVGEGHFLGAVHLRLDDVDRARARVAQAVRLAQVVHGDQRGAHRVEQAFEGLVAVAVEHGGVGHQVADVAHQHQRAALEGERARRRARCSSRSGLSVRSKLPPPLATVSTRSPRIRPSQLR